MMMRLESALFHSTHPCQDVFFFEFTVLICWADVGSIKYCAAFSDSMTVLDPDEKLPGTNMTPPEFGLVYVFV